MKTLHGIEEITEAAWPPDRFGEATFDIARLWRLSPRVAPLPAPSADVLADAGRLDTWFEATGDYFGIDIEPCETAYAEVDDMLARSAPCLLRFDGADGTRSALAILRSDRRKVTVLTPTYDRLQIELEELADLMRRQRAPAAGKQIDEWMAELSLPPRRRAKGAKALGRVVGKRVRVGGLWLLRPPPGAPLLLQMRHSGDAKRLAWFVAIQAAQVTLAILGWTALIDGSLVGRLETSNLVRWVLFALSVTVVEVARAYLLGRLNVSIAAILKRRLLAGALRMDPERIRRRGTGGLLAIIAETDALETTGVTSVLGIVSAAISLVAAGAILWNGLGGGLHVALLVAWCAFVLLSSIALGRTSRRWTDFRIAMTNSLVERMVGHRTRIAQQPRAEHHRREDEELELYLGESKVMDRLSILLRAVPARGWLVAGFLALIPSMLTGGADPKLLLIALGGLLTAQVAFGEIALAVNGLTGVVIALRRSADLFAAAANGGPFGLPRASAQPFGSSGDDTRHALEARNVTFRYVPTGEPVLRSCTVALRSGEKVLLRGSSGRGKSTLLSVLAGLRAPEAGMVLHHGLDRNTLGAASWRRRVASVPQFHENHILSASLLFNLVMGRRWPASEHDRKLAEEVCVDLGLGPLLDRMPARLEQVVGETGWQLSHGERSRVFLARALLQGADVVLIDESFGALDPETLAMAVDVAIRRTRTLLVVAHP